MVARIAWIVALTFLGQVGYAQNLVDPSKVAPEYREAAKKRRAEQLKIRDCEHKADEAKVLRRDRLAHLQKCMDEK